MRQMRRMGGQGDFASGYWLWIAGAISGPSVGAAGCGNGIGAIVRACCICQFQWWTGRMSRHATILPLPPICRFQCCSCWGNGANVALLPLPPSLCDSRAPMRTEGRDWGELFHDDSGGCDGCVRAMAGRIMVVMGNAGVGDHQGGDRSCSARHCSRAATAWGPSVFYRQVRQIRQT